MSTNHDETPGVSYHVGGTFEMRTTDKTRAVREENADDSLVFFAGTLRDRYLDEGRRDDGAVGIFVYDRGTDRHAVELRDRARYVVVFFGGTRVAYSSTFDGAVAACAHVLGEPVCIRAVDRLGVALDDGTTCSTDGVGYAARDRLVEEHGEEILGREVLVVDVPTDEDAKPWVRTETVASALFVE